MTILIIESNPNSITPDIIIEDIGIAVPFGGGSLTRDEFRELQEAQQSQALRKLVVDDAFGADSSTLILNDGTSQIAQTDVIDFLDTLLGGGGGGAAVSPVTWVARDSTNPNIVYIGRSKQGTPNAAAAEAQIYQYDSEAISIVQLYADGDLLYDNVWDDRESLPYP